MKLLNRLFKVSELLIEIWILIWMHLVFGLGYLEVYSTSFALILNLSQKNTRFLSSIFK